ncbi:tetratricopeptide repeat protein [Baaleninema simplex]|uniref:tetratricopeptide repeat protein n=1 Tax=Baaleninema simplex TaxID=2862350 RepID=UPI00034C0E11|nr:tetratricopeptide repeat protein [Baaleninema simplex]
MSKKRSGWITRIMLSVGLLAFLGFSLFPLLSGVLEARQTSQTPTPSPTSAANAVSEDDLSAQARGYELVLQREPDNETALRGLIDVRRQQGDIEGAIEPLERLAELNPDEPRYTILLAQTKQYLGDLEGAAETYRNLLTREPGSIQALQGLVDLLLQEGRPEAAVGVIEETLQLAPQANQDGADSIDVVSVQLLLGQVYAYQGRTEDALNVYENLIQEHSDDFRPLVGKALLLEQSGKVDEAKATLNTALSVAPPQHKDRIQILIDQLNEPAPEPAPEASSEESSEPSEEE